MLRKLKLHYFPLFFVIVLISVSLLSQSFASSNPWGDTGVDFKDNFKNKDVLGLDPKSVKQVELEADQVQFSQSNNKAKAHGNVVVTSEKTVLYADELELERSIGQAIASGHVYIDAPNMKVNAQRATFNFNDSTGEFENARIFNDPFQLNGQPATSAAD